MIDQKLIQRILARNVVIRSTGNSITCFATILEWKRNEN